MQLNLDRTNNIRQWNIEEVILWYRAISGKVNDPSNASIEMIKNCGHNSSLASESLKPVDTNEIQFTAT